MCYGSDDFFFRYCRKGAVIDYIIPDRFLCVFVIWIFFQGFELISLGGKGAKYERGYWDPLGCAGRVGFEEGILWE
jgi:hypothetical protein